MSVCWASISSWQMGRPASLVRACFMQLTSMKKIRWLTKCYVKRWIHASCVDSQGIKATSKWLTSKCMPCGMYCRSAISVTVRYLIPVCRVMWFMHNVCVRLKMHLILHRSTALTVVCYLPLYCVLSILRLYWYKCQVTCLWGIIPIPPKRILLS